MTDPEPVVEVRMTENSGVVRNWVSIRGFEGGEAEDEVSAEELGGVAEGLACDPVADKKQTMKTLSIKVSYVYGGVKGQPSRMIKKHTTCLPG